MTVATRILVVDDDAGLRKELRQLLEDAGYDVVAEASSGFQGVALARLALPDVVISDLRMPGDIGGLDLAAELQGEIPVIILSAYDDPGLQARVREVGCHVPGQGLPLADDLRRCRAGRDRRRGGPRMTRAGLPPLVPFAAGAAAALIGSSMARARTSPRPEGDLAEQRPGAPVACASDSVAVAPHEVAERRSLEKQLHLLEHTDPLTGAANRVRLRDRLAEMLGAEETTGALLILDLDDFRLVNELYGHTHGDLLLVEATRRLEIVARQFEGACLSRLGGDEFALLLPDVSLAEMRWVCAGLLNRLRQPVSLGPAEIEVGTSIGLVMLDAGRRDVDDALRDGDLAMYAAKAAGKNRWKQFAPAMHEDLVARLTLEGELAVAIDEDQLDVHYQPLVRLDGQRIVGVEALVRWNHPTRGPIPPEEFLVAAERGPLIHRLGGLDPAGRLPAAGGLVGGAGAGCAG